MRGLLLLSVIALLASAGCGQEPGCMVRGEGLVSIIDRTVSEGGEVIDLQEVAAFDWDRFFVFNEYSVSREIREAAGLDYAPDSIRNHVPEGFDLIVFTRDGQPICHFEMANGMSRSAGWTFYGSSYRKDGIGIANARFSIDRSGRVPRLVPAE